MFQMHQVHRSPLDAATAFRFGSTPRPRFVSRDLHAARRVGHRLVHLLVRITLPLSAAARRCFMRGTVGWFGKAVLLSAIGMALASPLLADSRACACSILESDFLPRRAASGRLPDHS